MLNPVRVGLLSFVLPFVVCVGFAQARSMLEGQHYVRVNEKQLLRSTVAVGPPPQYHTVAQDHFDGTNENTWEQAYFVNDTFWVPGSAAPVFVCVGGEGPALDGSAVVASPHCNIAVEWLEDTGALMFAVEHRYYGCHNSSACPVGDPLAVGGLKFLSSRQALGDLASFHAHMLEKYDLTASNKWVSWGGSYPGMLAGWFRLKFPHLVHASVASSAPVRAELDMVGYYDVTAQAYAVSDNGVGGSDECRQNIADGHATIGSLLNATEGRTQLSSLFPQIPSADWLKERANQRSFAGNGVAYFPAQGNDPTCEAPACNIKKICEIMTEKDNDNVSKLAALSQAQLTWTVPKWTVGEPEVKEADYWGYQTCTEFGFYQTCNEGSECFFTQGLMLLEDEVSFCTSEFGISLSKVSENVDFSNEYYGADKPSGSKVLYPNGEVDPWHANSILSPPNPDIPVLPIPGASHHAWTHPSDPRDQKSVVTSRQQIRDQVAAWLQ